MTLGNIKKNMTTRSIFFSENSIINKPTIIGYEKKFKWSWFATQLNTFIVATDFGDTRVSEKEMQELLTESFKFATKNYSGWPRGLQSALGVVAIIVAEDIDPEVIAYCNDLKSGKKWAGFSVPVAVKKSTNEIYFFDKNPMWGRIYYPYFKKLIQDIV